jgi:hypothetical protein
MPQRNAEVWVVGASETDGSDEPGAVGLSPEHPKRIMAAKTIRVDLTAIARVMTDTYETMALAKAHRRWIVGRKTDRGLERV